MNSRFILTGGVGCGKSATLHFLARPGVQVFDEAARRVMRSHHPYPVWEDRERFDRLLIDEMIRDYESAAISSVSFYDRGLPDLLGWARFYNMTAAPVSAYEELVHVYRYAPLVFFLPLVAEVYVQDAERPYTFDQSREIETAVRWGYERSGYRCFDVDFDLPSRMAQTILMVAQAEVLN